jgi:hypothetical protein
MIACGGMGNGQSETGSLSGGFGCKEGLEQVAPQIVGDPATVIVETVAHPVIR